MQANVRDHQPPYAIVIGLDTTQGLYAARTLARYNIPVIGIAASSKSFGCRTNVCKAILFADTATEDFIWMLESLGPTLNQKAVLVPCQDMSVLLISRHRQRLATWYHIALPAPDIVEMMLDKVCFYTYAQQEGLPIPMTYFLYSRADAEAVTRQLSFPCILKPPSSKYLTWKQHTALKAFKVSNAAELLAVYDRYNRWAEGLIAQQWIEGPDANLYSCHCYFDATAQPLVTFTSRKLRQWPPETGQACLAEECRNDLVLHETIQLFSRVHFRGLGYLELKCDARSGKYFIMEPNIGRPSGRMAIAEAGGVELLYTMYCDTIGWPLPANREQYYGNAKWIHWRQDFQSTLYSRWHGNLTLKEWWQAWHGRKTDALFAWHDLGPFLGDIQTVVGEVLSPQERRKRDYRRFLL